MRVMIVGQKWMGEQVLRLCQSAGYDVAAVAAPNDGDKLAVAARRDGIRVDLVPRRLGSDLVPAGCDVIVGAHAHAYVSAEARSRARLGAIGYHPSLLPRHRGRDAIRWALHMGDPITGGTVYWMDDGADTGPIAAQDWCWIRPGDTAASIWREILSPMGVRLLGQVLGQLQAGVQVRLAQDDAAATWEPAFTQARLSSQSPSHPD